MKDEPVSDRLLELRKLFEAKGFRTLSNEVVRDLVAAEDELAKDRIDVVSLSDSEIINDDEFVTLLERCFKKFILKAAEFVGADACEAIYDFRPPVATRIVPVQGVETWTINTITLPSVSEIIGPFGKGIRKRGEVMPELARDKYYPFVRGFIVIDGDVIGIDGGGSELYASGAHGLAVVDFNRFGSNDVDMRPALTLDIETNDPSAEEEKKK